MTRIDSLSTIERVVLAMGGLVILMDVVASLTIVFDGCAAIFGLLLWILASALFLLGVVLPALVRLARGPLRLEPTCCLALAAGASALPVGLNALMNYHGLGHCIA